MHIYKIITCLIKYIIFCWHLSNFLLSAIWILHFWSYEIPCVYLGFSCSILFHFVESIVLCLLFETFSAIFIQILLEVYILELYMLDII
jgi:hypothetical protein